MTTSCATTIGIILQLVGAGYIVFQSFRTWRHLAKFAGPPTYGSLSQSIEALVMELRSQFGQQLVGFAALFAGSAFQLYAAL